MTLLFGILLAVVCALATNVGFLYKHRGACSVPAVEMKRPLHSARSLFGSKLFAIGMLIAAAAWICHVAAMAIAPLSVVQAVLAGGVVLLAVMAERAFGLRIRRRQWVGLALTAGGLMLLGVTLPAVHGAHSAYSVPGMIGFETVLIAAGALLILGPRIGAPLHHEGFMLGAGAGIMFGVSDVSLKAISGLIGAHGALGLLCPWMAITIAASIAAFYASAKGLQHDDAVPVIAITGAAANVSGIVGGIVVFGDPLAGSPVALVVQVIAFIAVLVAAWLMPAPMRTAKPVAVTVAVA
jgi:hypothetical protein